MKKTISIFLLMILMLPILSACWNQKELTELAFVMALGIDKGKNNKYDVSFQMVNPGNVTTGQGGGGGGGQGLPIAVYRSSGDTLTEVSRLATKKISRKVYYAHTILLVVSEQIAKSGLLLDVLDSLDRDPEFRTTAEIVVTKGSSALSLLSALTILDKLPANMITKELKSTESMLGENMKVSIDDFMLSLVTPGTEPFVNGYKVVGKKSDAGKTSNLEQTTSAAYLEADGLAIFKAGKLVGWVDHKTARGIIWVLNKIKSTGINLDWDGKKNALNMVPIRSETKVAALVRNGKPEVDITIRDEGWLSEANLPIDLTDPANIEKIEGATSKEIQKQVLTSIKTIQKKKSDIFGFGEKFHHSNPNYWNKVKNNWDEQFAQLDVKVKVKTYIRREGIRTNPFWSDFKNKR